MIRVFSILLLATALLGCADNGEEPTPTLIVAKVHWSRCLFRSAREICHQGIWNQQGWPYPTVH
jgi:hypothetical protein